MTTQTERRAPYLDAEAVFRAFVQNANLLVGQRRTALAAPKEASAIEASVTAPISLASVSLEDRRGTAVGPPPPGLAHAMASLSEGGVDAPLAAAPPGHEVPGDEAEPIELVRRTDRPPPAGPEGAPEHAGRWVPDVRSVAPPPQPVPERSESGEVPPRQLERLLSDMGVLLRYGHAGEVERRLRQLLAEYPRDLLLLRRVAEFHLQVGNEEAAKACLFRLAKALFGRRNVPGMRAALEQVLVLDPHDERAQRLLALLERREA